MAQPALHRYGRLIRIAKRLGQIELGIITADIAIHQALSRPGAILHYTTDEEAARTLLPPGFEWMQITFTANWMYTPCRRAGIGADGLAYPHLGQWCQTIPLSLCAGVLRDAGALSRRTNLPKQPRAEHRWRQPPNWYT